MPEPQLEALFSFIDGGDISADDAAEMYEQTVRTFLKLRTTLERMAYAQPFGLLAQEFVVIRTQDHYDLFGELPKAQLQRLDQEFGKEFTSRLGMSVQEIIDLCEGSEEPPDTELVPEVIIDSIGNPEEGFPDTDQVSEVIQDDAPLVIPISQPGLIGLEEVKPTKAYDSSSVTGLQGLEIAVGNETQDYTVCKNWRSFPAVWRTAVRQRMKAIDITGMNECQCANCKIGAALAVNGLDPNKPFDPGLTNQLLDNLVCLNTQD